MTEIQKIRLKREVLNILNNQIQRLKEDMDFIEIEMVRLLTDEQMNFILSLKLEVKEVA